MTHTRTVSTTTFTPYVAVAALIDSAGELEDSLVTALLADNVTTLTQRAGRVTLVATSFDETAVAAGGLRVPFDGNKGEVVVPASLFHLPDVAAAEGIVLMVATYDLTSEDDFGNSSEVQVAGVVNVNLLTTTGRRLDVSGLAEPIKVVLPVNFSTGLQCGFWDEDTSSWSTMGVELGTVGQGTVECLTTHLTLFGAIIRGFVKTVTCSQVTLLNAESIAELGKADWQRTRGASVLWFVLATFAVLMLVATWVDRDRWTHGRCLAEHLLIPLQDALAEQPPQGAPPQKLPQEEPSREEPSREEPLHQGPPQASSSEDAWASKMQRGLGVCAACLVVGIEWCRSSSSLRAAADEVFSQWFGYFGEVRDLIEGLADGLECSMPTCTQGVTLINRILTKTLVLSVRRQAAASLHVSWDTSSLATQTEGDMIEVVRAHRSRRNASLNHAGAATLAREETWGELYHSIEVKLDVILKDSARWSSVPATIWRLFVHENPISACLVRCVFTSCKLRTLLFMVELAGSVLITTVFFSASGVPGKRSRSFQCTTGHSTWEFVGRVLAIGTGSLVLASIPSIILASLCTRALKKLEYEGCPQWKKQLRVWRIQDRAIWVFGSLYVAFCIFFACLFLANVDEEDHAEWLLSGLLSVMESIVLMPLLVALVQPLLVMTCLHFMSSRRRVTKEDLVSELHLKFKQDARMNMTVGRV